MQTTNIDNKYSLNTIINLLLTDKIVLYKIIENRKITYSKELSHYKNPEGVLRYKCIDTIDNYIHSYTLLIKFTSKNSVINEAIIDKIVYGYVFYNGYRNNYYDINFETIHPHLLKYLISKIEDTSINANFFEDCAL